MCVIDLLGQAYCDSVDRALLWVVLARLGVPPGMLDSTRQFHDGICEHARGWMMASARVCSTWGRSFGKGGCVLKTLLFNTIFTVVLRVAEQRITADAAISNSIVLCQ